MINTKVMSVFTIIAIAAMMSAASIIPAYAATKVLDDDFDIDFVQFAPACGQIALVDGNIKGHIIIWDNNKFNFSAVENDVLLDNLGNKIGTAHATLNEVGTFGDAPQVFQFNVKITCDGSGQESNLHSGLTLHKDGTITPHGF